MRKERKYTVKKEMIIEGMHCGHCQARVEKILGELSGVESAKVNLKNKTALISLSQNVEDAALMQAVNDAGYQAVSIREKKGLFGR